MSSADFSSRDGSSFERTVDCSLENVTKTAEQDLVRKYDLHRCIDWVKQNNYQRVCLQFPDCLLPDSIAVSLYLQAKFSCSFFILGDTSYGSCCVDEIAAEHVNGDGIIHFGHACLSRTFRLPVLYIFMDEDLKMEKLRESIINTFKEDENVLLFYGVEFHHVFSQQCDKFLLHRNIIITSLKMNNTSKDNLLTTESDSLTFFARSFEFNRNKTYSAVFIGQDGLLLHNLILALPDVKWYHYENEILAEFKLNTSRFLMKRLHFVEKVKDAHVIGVLIGTLGIANYLNAVDRIRLLAKKRGKKCYTLAVGRPNVAKLANFPEIDVFVLVACPESNLSRDSKDFFKPIVTLFEMEMALGGREWSAKYLADFSDVLLTASEQVEQQPQEETADVSLLSGRVRSANKEDEAELNATMDVAERARGTLTEYSGASYLANREWRGLEQMLGQTGVEKAVKGREGVPQSYQHETETLGQP